MNSSHSINELQEAEVHIKKLIENLQSTPAQESDEYALSIQFGHILEHLNLAWHYRRMSDQDVDQLTQKSFENFSKSIPNFAYEMRLLEGLEVVEKGEGGRGQSTIYDKIP